MRLISIKSIKEGMVLGRTVWNDAHHPLVQKDVALTATMISRLNELNIQYVYIDDELSNGIIPIEIVPEQVRQQAVREIKTCFESIKGLNVRETAYLLDQKSKVLADVVDDMMSYVMASQDLLTILGDTFLYDSYIFHHSYQVTLYTIAIAKELKYKQEDMRQLAMGALLHDVGKMLIPLEILQKPGKLTVYEYKEIQNHALYGYDILRGLHTVSLKAAHCAYQHHERLNGSGYPRGIVDKEIHPYAKVIAVADVFDAMTSNRTYRNKILPTESLSVLFDGVNTLFDFQVVDALSNSITYYPNGVMVQLTNRARGIVSKQNPKSNIRPWVRIFEEKGRLLPATYEINLLDYPEVSIDHVEFEMENE